MHSTDPAPGTVQAMCILNSFTFQKWLAASKLCFGDGALAHTNLLAVLWIVDAGPQASDHFNCSPAQITNSVPWHHLAIGKENLDSVCLIFAQNWVFFS